MAIIQNLINIDTVFHNTERKIILNDLKLTDPNLKDLIYTISGEKVSLIPQCECGHYKRTYLLGHTCPRCKTDVIKPFDSIKPLLWVRRLDEDLQFINPKFWADLSHIISTKMDGLRWLSDTSYNPPKVPPVLHNIKELIGGRSYTNVVNNIEKIITYLKHNGQYKTITKRTKLEILHGVYKRKKDVIFSDTLPMINKKLFISEQSIDGSYNTILLADIIDLVLMVITISNDTTITKNKLNNSMGKLISKSAKLFVSYVKEMVSRKGGLVRKNIYGTRAHFTFRTVISALDSKYDYDTIRVPWIIGLTTYRPHVLNKLLRKGYTYAVASDIIFNSCLVYNHEIDEILKELIAESPEKGLPVFANRNPTLGKSSIQKLFIVEFKTDIEDKTTDLAKAVMPGFNADLDGDAMNFTALLSRKLSKLADVFSPHYNVNALGVYKVSGNLNLPKTTALTIANYLHKDEPQLDECPIYDMIVDIDLANTKSL